MRHTGGRKGRGRTGAAAVIAAALLLSAPAASVLSAQEPAPAPVPQPRPAPDTARPVPAPPPPDTVRGPGEGLPAPQGPPQAVPDSLDPDSLRPPMPAFGPAPGPLPAGRRVVFTRADVKWSGAFTLGDLLNEIPGVFVVRAGWYGQPEVVAYAGQGSASVELYWDGYALDGLGADSLGFDGGRFDLGLYERIEVEVLPSVLRVHLISDTQRPRRPRTEVSFSTGDAATNAYRVRYLNRFRNGFGLGLGVSYFGTQGPTTSRGKVTDLGLWAKATWTPSDLFGVEYQAVRRTVEREALAPTQGSGASIDGFGANRTDSFLRAFAASRADGYGWRLDAQLGASSWSDSAGTSVSRVAQAAIDVSYRGRRWSGELLTRQRDGVNPFDATLRGSWSPVRPVTLSGLARRRWVLGGGTLTETDAGASVRPLGALVLHGDLRWRRLDDSVLTTVDTVQRVQDWDLGAGFQSRRLGLDVTVGRHGAFQAPLFGQFDAELPVLTTTGATSVTASWRLSPARWLTLSGWYRHPLGDTTSAFEPPHHSLTRLTFRSMFLPHFRQGAFDVMGRVEMEAWGHGLAAVDTAGNAIVLPGKTVFNFHVQFRLVGAVIFYTIRNPQLVRYSLIPGFEMPRSQQRFGIMWEFVN